MDFRRYSVQMKYVLKEAINMRNRNDNLYKYELAALFARIWFLKAEILEQSSSCTSNSLNKYMKDDFIEDFQRRAKCIHKSFWKDKEEGQLLKLVERMGSLCESSELEEFVASKVKDLLYKFLVQAMLSKADMFLSELRENSGFDEIGELREGLMFLIKSEIYNPTELEDTEDVKQILRDLEGLASQIISVCNFGSDRRVEQLSQLLEKVKPLKGNLKRLYFNITRPPFPTNPRLGPMKSLLHKLNLKSAASPTYQIRAVSQDLRYILSVHGNILNEERCRDIRARLVDASYQVEYVIDSFGHTKYSESQLLMWLYDQSEIIHRSVEDLTDYFNNSTSDDEVEESADRYDPTGPPSCLEGSMVGFKLEKHEIMHQLIGGRKRTGVDERTRVVTITGMPGIVKTSLATDVFHHPLIKHHFHCQLWCAVSQAFRERRMLLDLLHQVSEHNSSFQTMSIEDLRNKLRQSLKGKKYLIVMDDVWSSEPLDILRNSFPDDYVGSRILLTSCLNRNVGEIWDSVSCPLQGLSDSDSCLLLNMKLFRSQVCPPQLEPGIMQIAKSCKGIPFVIVSVASLLSRVDSEEAWIEVSIRMSRQIVSAQETEFTSLFEQSYQHLSGNVQQCFLYLGVFPKGQDISVQKLLWLWIAEGFVESEGSESLDFVAEQYLMDLIERNLVTAGKRGSNGRVKTCKVHDQILGFCLFKAKKERFFQLISGEPSDVLHHEPAESRSIDSEYRVSICGDPESFIPSSPSDSTSKGSGSPVRSLLIFATNDMFPGLHSDMSSISDDFNLLKVADFESVNVGDTLESTIELLVHLRYLGIGGDMDSLPPSLSKLQYLETLIVKGLRNKFVLPDTIWSMKSLRHIHVSNHCIFTLQNDKEGSDSTLYNLVSLSMPSFSYVMETEFTLKRFPNLRKLKCIFLEPCVGSTHRSQFPRLESLVYLESLKLSYSGWPLDTIAWSLPSGLKELTLSNFQLPWDQFSASIRELPNLEVLKLISRAFVGSVWNVRDGDFIKLKYLKLDSLDVVSWNDHGDECIPCLEQLILQNCKQLEELPDTLTYSASLLRIEAHNCGPSVEAAVKRIVEERMDYLNNLITTNLTRIVEEQMDYLNNLITTNFVHVVGSLYM